MSKQTTPFTPEQIGSSRVRFSSSGIFSTHKDHMVDPYVATRMPKESQVEGTQYTPQSQGVFPAIVLLHDRWGLTTHIHTLAQQLACEGYIVLAPNLYGRQGGMITANDEVAEALMNRLDEPLALQDINACCEYLNTNISEDSLLDNMKRNMHAIIGFGMGGGLAFRFAARRRRLKAAVSFYGSIPDDGEQLAKDLHCPLLCHTTNQNGSSSLDTMHQLQGQAKEAGKTIEILAYPEAPVGFCNQLNPETYQPETAEQAFHKTVEFLNGILRAS